MLEQGRISKEEAQEVLQWLQTSCSTLAYVVMEGASILSMCTGRIGNDPLPGHSLVVSKSVERHYTKGWPACPIIQVVLDLDI